jgi:hypothetical protein
MSAALIAAAFGFALPHVASYRSVWASLGALSWPYAVLVATAAVASMAAYWLTIRAVLPWIRMRQAATVSLGSNAVANTLPAGGALAMGVSWAMLSSWGLSTSGYVLYTLVTGVWNVLALLGLPVLALVVMTTASRPDALLISAAAVGLALLTAMACGPPWSSPPGWPADRRPPRPLGRCPASGTRPAPCSVRAAGGSPQPPWPAISPCGLFC